MFTSVNINVQPHRFSGQVYLAVLIHIVETLYKRESELNSAHMFMGMQTCFSFKFMHDNYIVITVNGLKIVVS